MPPRIARSSIPNATERKQDVRGSKHRKRHFDAFAIASHSVPLKTGVRRNRLGEVLNDGGAKSKRRKISQRDESEGEDEGEEEVRTKNSQRRKSSPGGETAEEGSDSEGNEWKLGGLREDDEDSELDSDDAFGESDEERFAGFTFRGSSSRGNGKQRNPQVKEDFDDGGIDLDEDEGVQSENEEEDEFGDEGIDLATMLDDEDDEATNPNMDDEDEDQDPDSPSEADSDGDSFDDHNNEEANARMRDRIEALDPAEQIPFEASSELQSRPLTVEDLLAVGLGSAAKAELTKERKRSKNVKPYTAPLLPLQQGRLDREVANKKAKEQLDRWRDTIIHNRRAEFLSFPLPTADGGHAIGKEKFLDSKPQNELEESIREIMEESGLASGSFGADAAGEDAVMTSEELVQKDMPVEEVMRRRAELRRTRELLFREEIKAKRIKKIKSRAYRRVHRKERERERENMLLDEGEPEDEREKNDRRRAEERMSTKHKSSKWGKSLRETGRAVWDDEAKGSVVEMARKKEELRRRMVGIDVEDSGSVSDYETADEGEDGDGGILRQLERMQDDGEDNGSANKGLAGLKFMRDADERRKKQNQEDILRLKKELAAENGEEEEEEEMEGHSLGRAIFSPKENEKKSVRTVHKRPELEEGDLSDEGEDEGPGEVEIVTDSAKPAENGTARNAKANSKSTKRTPQPEKPIAGYDWLTMPLKGSKKDRRRAREVKEVDVIETITPFTKGKGNNDDASKKSSKVEAKDANDSDSDPEPMNPILQAHEKEAQSYHERAFAGDDVKLAFQAEKDAIIASEDEKETSSHLPGWGAWTGEGLSKSVRKANARQRNNPLFKTKLPGVRAENRKDKGRVDVIVSEKLSKDRKGKKYMADILPHQFEKGVQYERALRLPLGPEWSTKEVWQRNTRPRVVVKPGVVVAPMERPLL